MQGPCKNKPPYFGLVKRSMNRPPGPTDSWWGKHQKTCGGTFVKIRSPEPTKKVTNPRKKKKKEEEDDEKTPKEEEGKKKTSIGDFFKLFIK